MKSTEKHHGARAVREDYLLDFDKSPFALTEAYRNLMTNISFALPQKPEGKGKIVCVSSSVSGEGKTTIACNLAVTFANSGKRTVIVDCDLRKHNVNRFFKTRTVHSFVECLSGEASLDDVIIRDVVPNLDVIASSKNAPNPIVLFNNEVFDELLAELAERYDYVIIDTPPVGVVSEGFTIASKADGIVLVVKRLVTHRILQETLSDLEFAKCNLLGFVLKDFLIEKSNGRSYKYYGYYGYYGYDDKSQHGGKEESAESSRVAE